jgi:putative phosphoesterase
MRIAIVSDIHGNLTAFEAVLSDLKQISPDLIFHGGDLADNGSGGPEILDRIRDLGWPGVYGNTDEMLFRPESLAEFGLPPALAEPIQEMAAWSRQQLGEDRIAWLRALPMTVRHGDLALVHASPATCWRATSDSELESLGARLAVFGHIHRPFVRDTVANSGSVGQPHDGDQRAAYLLIDDGAASIRRVEYDVDRELKALASSGLPHAGWIGKILQAAAPQMP